MSAPIVYLPNFVSEPEVTFSELRDELAWVRVGTTPRSEYYCNVYDEPYTYGSGRGVRTYQVQPWHRRIDSIRAALNERLQTNLDVCFLNRYHDQSDHLGWHADDSPEMDDERPIVTVSLGAEREIWFRKVVVYRCNQCRSERETLPDGNRAHHHKMSCYTGEYRPIWDGNPERVLLQHGSACIMSPGMQETWQHRIPKAGRTVGERISLTFRGYVPGAKK